VIVRTGISIAVLIPFALIGWNTAATMPFLYFAAIHGGSVTAHRGAPTGPRKGSCGPCKGPAPGGLRASCARMLGTASRSRRLR
jgi:hypothetical protein